MDLSPFRTLVREHCGLFFEKEKTALLENALRTRMAVHGFNRSRDLLALMRRDAREVAQFVELLLINETYFFREPEHLAILTDHLLPELLAKRAPGRVKILSAGCSTGEEAYSIAIALLEAGGPDLGRQVKINAIDISTETIRKAQAGSFGRASFRGAELPLREKYFDPVGEGGYRIRECARRLVEFACVNLRGDSYPPLMSGLDVIFYRNVSIYFPAPVQQEIFSRLAGLLNPDGYLLVSATETMHHNTGTLTLVELGGKFLFQKRITADLRKVPPPPRPTAPVFRPPPPVVPRRRPAPVGGRAEPGETVADRLEGVRLRTLAKDYPAALQRIEALLNEEPACAQAYALKGSVLINLGRLEEAASACRLALERDRWSLEGCLLLGMIGRLEKREDEAQRHFKEALYIDPSCWLAHYYLGELHAARGESESARREFAIVLKLIDKGGLSAPGLRLFPLAFEAEQLAQLCRHHLARLAPAPSDPAP